MKEEQKKGFFKIAELLQEGDESKGKTVSQSLTVL